MKKRVLVAMSGGVDSSVAPLLLQEAGYECVGVTMRLSQDREAFGKKLACGSLDDVADAKRVCDALGMDHRVIDLSKNFDQAVIQKFVKTYERGWTPNPCVDCNRTIKFGSLLDYADREGFSYIATGHYARILQRKGRFLLAKGLDPGKDQSYMLYSFSQAVFSRILLPIGGLEKARVRQLAEENQLPTAHKEDSQDICFIPDGDYVGFLRRYQGKDYPPGDLVDSTGKVLGRHKGAIAYTIGQRRGLGLAADRPLYVYGKDMEKNQVLVGGAEELFSEGLLAFDWNWVLEPTTEPVRVQAKIRYNARPAPATLTPGAEAGTMHLVFDQPQRAVAAGQAVVCYQDDLVLGGGTIAGAERKNG